MYDYSPFLDGRGSSFQASATFNIKSCTFYLKKNVAPTGNITAKIYEHSGTFGTSSLPTGVVYATSDNVDVSTLSTSLADVTFTFSGINQKRLISGNYYILVLDVSDMGAASGNYVSMGYGGAVDGNGCYHYLGSWTAHATDYQYKIYGDVPTPASFLSFI